MIVSMYQLGGDFMLGEDRTVELIDQIGIKNSNE